MIRLMCKSRTRNIRRMIFSLVTALAIMVQAFSVSFESNAKISSGTVSPHSIIVTDSVVRYNSVSMSSTYNTFGFLIFSLPFSGDFRANIPSSYDSVFVDISTEHYSLSYSLDSGYSLNGSGFFALGPYVNVASLDDLYMVHFQNGSYVVPLYSNYSIYRLYYVIPFRYYGSPQVSASDSNSLTFVLEVNLAPYRTGYDVNTSDIQKQTEQIQNSMQDQTETVTEGYDNSQITSDNEQLADSMQEYDNSQSAAVGDSTGYIDDVSFYNPSSSAQVMSGITLTGSFLQSLFENMGQWSAVVLVSLSLTFGLMLVGWFKFRK